MTMASEQPTVVTPADWVSGPRQGEWTYDAYAVLPDDGQRYEIIDGLLLLVVSAHSPLKGTTHTSLGVFSGELTLPSLIVPALKEVPAEKFFG